MLLGPNGRPISTRDFSNKKADAPKTGPGFGNWAGRDLEFLTLPGGGVVAFDLSKLTVQDFRQMRDHYQINASLSVLSFMQHQSDWHIEHSDKKIRDFSTEQFMNNWTGLNRAMATSNWAGYSPSALQWENEARRIVLDKVKDLMPEECEVKWDLVDGYAPPGRVPPKFKVYGGIKQFGSPWPIPIENSLWYPMLMEQGDYYGRKLLRPAFTSYFFSLLLHLFANRYYERFGEPTPVGRAPMDEDVTFGGKTQASNEYMLDVLKNLRNRGIVILPSDRTAQGNETNPDYDYDLEYLESQMRGADFDRYMTRLDEEMSIGLFTPILLLRTADVGSYNLGQGHMQVYLWMLNAMNDDRKVYLDKYILSKMTDYNFGLNAERPRIVFRKLGAQNGEMIKELLTALTQQNKIGFDYDELGQIAGMSIKEVRETTSSDADPAAEPSEDAEGVDPATEGTDAAAIVIRRAAARDAGTAIVARVRGQIESAFKDDTFRAGLQVNMGFKRRMAKALEADGVAAANIRTDELYAEMDKWITTLVELGTEEFSTPDEAVDMFSNILNQKITHALR